jgi:hypothetical protein
MLEHVADPFSTGLPPSGHATPLGLDPSGQILNNRNFGATPMAWIVRRRCHADYRQR